MIGVHAQHIALGGSFERHFDVAHSVASIDTPVIHDLRIMETHRFRQRTKMHL